MNLTGPLHKQQTNENANLSRQFISNSKAKPFEWQAKLVQPAQWNERQLDAKSIALSQKLAFNMNPPKRYLMSWRQFQRNTLLLIASLVSVCAHLAAASSILSEALRLRVPSELQISGNTPTLRIEFNGSVIEPGQSLPARAFRNFDLTKSVSWPSHSDTRYTLLLVDLDRKLPGLNTTSIYNQYTNLNIPGDAVGSGQVIVAFELPQIACSPATKHRLAMLAFEQDQILEMSDVAYLAAVSGDPKKREIPKFEVFTTRHRLRLAAANVFQIAGETSSLCSSAASLKPAQFLLPLVVIAIVSLQLATLGKRH